jgi:LAS superfamily LD-carboxypeptidase LdcB
MSPSEAITTTILTGYREGQKFHFDALEVECGHYMQARCAEQAKDAIRAGREDGIAISIESAFRSMEQQERLHTGWARRDPGFNPADPPGYSKHQDGTALDLAFDSADARERFAALAVAHGFTRPHPREPWHFVITPQPKELS